MFFLDRLRFKNTGGLCVDAIHPWEKMADKKGNKDDVGDGGGNDANGEEFKKLLARLVLAQDGKAQPKEQQRPEEKDFRFWKTQPVAQFNEDARSDSVEGPIEPVSSVDDVPQQPLPLPEAYEWTDCDVDDEEQLTALYTLLNLHYVEDDDNMFRFDYSPEFLRWALQPLGFFKSWHLGVQVKSNKKLVAFISAIPCVIRFRDQEVKLCEVNFLCVHKKLRSKRLAPVLIQEVTRRVHLKDMWQASRVFFLVVPFFLKKKGVCVCVCVWK